MAAAIIAACAGGVWGGGWGGGWGRVAYGMTLDAPSTGAPTTTSPTPAEPPSAPSRDPALTSPTVEDDLLDQRRERPAPPPVEPDPAPGGGQSAVPSVPAPGLSAVPGIDRLSYALPNRVFRAEGSYVVQVRGVVIRLPGGEHVFVPDMPTDGSPGEQPMLLMPSQRLASIEALTKSQDAPLAVSLSGQVYAYRQRQYVLASAFSVIEVAAPDAGNASGASGGSGGAANGGTASGGTANGGAASGATPADTATARDPRVDDLIRDLETQTRGQRLLAPPTATEERAGAGDAGASRDRAGDAPLLPEGSLLMNRRGRLVRLAGSDGRYAFVLDNDGNSPSPGALVILPCRVLESMEGLAAMRGDEASFRVSGRVLVHMGRNYLLPTLAQVERPTDLMPMQ
jgi:hypothetical protein